MSTVTTGSVYRAMSPEDKVALNELRDAETKRVGKPVTLADIIAAVTPGLPDPAYLKG